MSNVNLNRCTPRQIRQFIIDLISIGLVPFIKSSPGLGKSSIIRQIAKDYRLKLIDHRISTSEPTDFNGLPNFTSDGNAYFAQFKDIFPLENDPIPEGYEGFLLFLDEFNSGLLQTQSACYKLVLDKMVGQARLHPKCVIVLAGNLLTDKAIVEDLSTAMKSRVITLEMVEDFKEWLEDVALPEKYDSRLIGFLSQYPNKLMQFNPNSDNDSFNCPRTWSFVNNSLSIEKEYIIPTNRTPLYTGMIDPGTAVEFINYTKAYNDLINYKDIINDPIGCKLPDSKNGKWITITHLMEYLDKDTINPFSQYVGRFELHLKILFFRMIKIQHPELKRHPAYINALIELDRYLNE